MGALFGAKPKGPSLAQRTQDFYTQLQQSQAAARSAGQQAVTAQSAAAPPAAKPTLDENDLAKRSAGGFFGTGTYLGSGSSGGLRGTFLS